MAKSEFKYLTTDIKCARMAQIRFLEFEKMKIKRFLKIF